jgi:NADP-dependent 3-hydroxy acid dehydrogenase YdfG
MRYHCADRDGFVLLFKLGSAVPQFFNPSIFVLKKDKVWHSSQTRLQSLLVVQAGSGGRLRSAMEPRVPMLLSPISTWQAPIRSLRQFALAAAMPCQSCSLIERAVERYGTLDILVNNASLTRTERHFLEADTEWWERIIAVNLSSSFHCSRPAAQIMARKGSGVIINMSSGGASRAHRGNAAYDAAKGGIEALTRAMALDLGPYGVRVNALVPGSIDSRGMDAEVKASRGETIPLGRVGEPEELAGPAVFLASDDARYITGHLLVVDGGLLAQQRSPQVDIFPLSRYPKADNG